MGPLSTAYVRALHTLSESRLCSLLEIIAGRQDCRSSFRRQDRGEDIVENIAEFLGLSSENEHDSPATSPLLFRWPFRHARAQSTDVEYCLQALG